jgi:glucokinase
MSKTIANCFASGIDIGGTKIAAAVFDKNNNQIAQISQPTPQEYGDMVNLCVSMIRGFDEKLNAYVTVGVGVPGSVDYESGTVPIATNTPALSGKPLQKDMEKENSSQNEQ